MDDGNFDSTLKLWCGEKGVRPGDLNSHLDGAASGEVVGRFIALGRRANMRIAVLGYSMREARCAYAVIRATTDPADQALRVDVYPEQKDTNHALRLGALVLEPAGSKLSPRLGSQHLTPEN